MFLLFSLIFLSKFEYEHYQMFGMKIGEKCLLYVRFNIVCSKTSFAILFHFIDLKYSDDRIFIAIPVTL